jgi:amino acid transporter, AAT family
VTASAFRMPGAPVANWFVLAFLVLVAVMLGFDNENRVALYVAPFWFGGLTIAYRYRRSVAVAQVV